MYDDTLYDKINPDIRMDAEEEKKYDALHRAILSGLLIGIAQRGDDGLYSAASPGAREQRELPRCKSPACNKRISTP